MAGGFFEKVDDFLFHPEELTKAGRKGKQMQQIMEIGHGAVGQCEQLKTELKSDEADFISQLKSHQNNFTSQFKDNAAKGDWVDSAIEEIENITKKFDDL